MEIEDQTGPTAMDPSTKLWIHFEMRPKAPAI